MREAGRKAAAVAATAAVVVTAACGGGGGRLSKSQYEQKLKAEGTNLRAALGGLNLAGVSNLKSLAPKLGQAQQKVEKAASDIDKLEPPKQVASDNAKIASSLHKFAKIFGQMKDAAAANQRAKIASLVSSLQTAASEGSQATQDLKAKGYDIGEFGR